MKILFKAALIIIFGINLAFAANNCKDEAPMIINKIENYDIIATNVADIKTAFAFKGNNLKYSFKAARHHKQNLISINSTTGVLRIDAEKRDNFDVTIIATNKCGKAKIKFNVQIDEEQ